MHIHQVAKCEADPAKPDDAFKSAGPHFNPEGKKHGSKNPDGPHAGDLPNFTVSAGGTAKGSLDARGVLLFGGKNGLWENDGASLVIHAKADDLMTDPAGNSGPRIACGVITKSANYKGTKKAD
jgi:Cu-Zn family superoxide dismutase